MRTISIISQKGGAGKTTLAIHLAGASASAGLSTLILDADPQATASQWSQWRGESDPEVIDCASPTLLRRKVQQAADLGAELVIIDTPPHADIMAREACKVADLILIPCRPQAFDLSAVETTAELVKAAGKPAFILFMGGPQPCACNLQGCSRPDRGQRRVGRGWACRLRLSCSLSGPSTTTARRREKPAAEAEPDGKAAGELAALWTWTRERVNLPTRKQNRKKRD
jgi:chromosome partitioning protein